MKFGRPHWRALWRYLIIFTAIALLPLALVYLLEIEQIYKFKKYEDTKYNAARFVDPSFRYPVMLLGQNKDRTLSEMPHPQRKFTKYDKYVGESRVPLIPDDEIQSLSPNVLDEIEQRNLRRREYLKKKCSENGLDVVGNDSWHKPSAWEFLVNRKYRIIWCNVFKAASSSWMFNFNVLAGYSPQFLHKTKEVPLSLARERYPRVSFKELIDAQNDSTTFIIARHPFERLLSAYRDKFVFAVPHSFHDKLGRKIIRTYRMKNNQADGSNTKYPSFSEFVRFLLDEIKMDNTLDMHFVSSTLFCTPCLIKFDVIIKFETLEQDQMYLIEKTGLKHTIFPEWQNPAKGKNTLQLLQNFYSQLTVEELKGLHSYYKYDFELFNYSATEYFNIVQTKSVDNNSSGNFTKISTPATF